MEILNYMSRTDIHVFCGITFSQTMYYRFVGLYHINQMIPYFSNGLIDFQKKSKYSNLYSFSDVPIYKLKKKKKIFKIYTSASCPYNFSGDIGVYKF